MSAGTLISLEEYLNTSYSPDMEFRDGVLVERSVGDEPHADVQTALGAYLRRRRKQWKIHVYTELRVRLRANLCPIPDVCVYPEPKFEGRYPSEPPVLWIEILSHDDRMIDVWAKADELIANGVPYVWIIDPNTLESELRTANGLEPVPNRTLRLPGTSLVIPLVDVMEE